MKTKINHQDFHCLLNLFCYITCQNDNNVAAPIQVSLTSAHAPLMFSGCPSRDWLDNIHLNVFFMPNLKVTLTLYTTSTKSRQCV